MTAALAEAQVATVENEVPIGAVVVCNGKIVGRGHNMTQALKDVTAHAEIIALTAASETLGGKYLPECALYVTVEPCVMCAGAVGWSHIGKLVYGASDIKAGFESRYRISPSPLHPKTTVVRNVLANECKKLISSFFLQKR